MEEKNTNSKTWLIAGLIVWTATVPLLSGAAESPAKAFGINGEKYLFE